VRDILGNLFQPPSEFWFLPAGATQGHPRHVADVRVLAWNGGTVPRLARTIYRERCFEDLPVLADALEEAGCDDDGILAHCRRPRPHVRGCWVVDLVRSVD
jgi:hypothetical protein